MACSYQLDDSCDPLATVVEFVEAYHQVLPLERAELDILYDLIRARLVMTVAITEWRAAEISREEGQACLLRACGMQSLW